MLPTDTLKEFQCAELARVVVGGLPRHLKKLSRVYRALSVGSKLEAPPVLHGLTLHSGRMRRREGRHRKERARLALE